MYQKAVSKLKSEIGQSKDKQFVKVVGEFLLDHLNIYPQDAEKIMAVDKTIVKSVDEMWKVAGKIKVNNRAGMTGEEGMAIVFKYFGIETTVDVSVMTAAPAANAHKPEVDFDVNIDDFL